MLCVLLLPACDEKTVTGPSVPLNQQFTLAPGEIAAIQGTSAGVHFLRVSEDSRCPADAFCVQGGDALVQIAVRDRTADEFALHTGDSSRGSVVRDGLRIALIALQPYRSAAAPSRPTSTEPRFWSRNSVAAARAVPLTVAIIPLVIQRARSGTAMPPVPSCSILDSRVNREHVSFEVTDRPGAADARLGRRQVIGCIVDSVVQNEHASVRAVHPPTMAGCATTGPPCRPVTISALPLGLARAHRASAAGVPPGGRTARVSIRQQEGPRHEH